MMLRTSMRHATSRDITSGTSDTERERNGLGAITNTPGRDLDHDHGSAPAGRPFLTADTTGIAALETAPRPPAISRLLSADDAGKASTHTAGLGWGEGSWRELPHQDISNDRKLAVQFTKNMDDNAVIPAVYVGETS